MEDNIDTPTAWRIIPLQTYEASMNMAIDQAIADSVLKGESPPTIRFYKWENGAVSFGVDKFEELVNKSACKQAGVDFVRRPSGGNAVYHAPDDLTYSVICQQYLLGNKNPQEINKTAYRTICSWIIDALNNIGIKSEFYGKNDIVQPTTLKKLVGNAQRKMSNKVLLQHGAIFNTADPEQWALYINVPKTQLEGITSLSACGIFNQDKVYKALLNAFTHNSQIKEFYFDKLSPAELTKATQLAKTKYKSIEDPKDYHLRKGTACVIDHFKQ